MRETAVPPRGVGVAFQATKPEVLGSIPDAAIPTFFFFFFFSSKDKAAGIVADLVLTLAIGGRPQT
jgi:hypothetical protein